MACSPDPKSSSPGVKAGAPSQSEPIPTNAVGWRIFLQEIQRDILLWFISFSILGGFRILMIAWFRDQIQTGHGAAEIIQAVMRGARFDCMVATYSVLPSLALTCMCLFRDMSRAAQRVRSVSAILTVAAHLAICGITVGYFREYHDQFNQWIVGLLTDNLTAILLTIWRGYPVLVYFVCFVAVIVLWGWAAPRLLNCFPLWKTPFNVRPRSLQVVVALLVCGLFFLAIRGWGIRRPIKQRDLSATRDVFLNKLVANPYVALRYAILDYRYIISARGLSSFLGDRSVLDAARVVFPTATSWKDLDELCGRKAQGRPGDKPRHIFLIVGESLDAWPMLPQYKELGLADGLLRLAANGIAVKPFLSAGDATIHATCTLVSGLPEAGVNLNYQPSSRTPFATASAPIFKRLGYRTRFICGISSWQRADEFCLAQGFDEFIGAATSKNLPARAIGTWGAFDEYLFDLVLREIPADLPSFNIILTTANHPPYDCDVFGRGFPHKTMPPPFDKLYDKTDPMKVFGHQWYTAKCISEFVNSAEKRFPGSVFVITGDHASRHFLNSHPSLFERTAVPCIFYGPDVLRDVKPTHPMSGSHLDLIASLVEMSADTGFEYAAFGRNILAQCSNPIGFCSHAVVTPRFILDVKNPDWIEATPGEVPGNFSSERENLLEQHSSLHALAWWRVMKGSKL